MFEDNQAREIRRLGQVADRIEAYAQDLSVLQAGELRAKSEGFRGQLQNGASLTSLIPEAFAVVREAAHRVLGERHFRVQLMGGVALAEGHIAEMQTGEGKTLTGTLPVYLHALTGKGVHVATVNDYLAQRDCGMMGDIFRYLGLSAGCVVKGMSREERRLAYACDITYGTSSEFGFDYLHDHLAVLDEMTVQRPLYYALIDEVDSILIDEVRTPLIISGRARQSTEHYFRANLFAATLRAESGFNVDPHLNAIVLTETSVRHAEEYFGIDNLFSEDHVLINHHINQALRAHHMLRRDVDYVVKNEEIVLVDEHTGRLMDGRRYSDGLHQAIEAKEGLQLHAESMTHAAITLQHYFRMYPRIAGMTGTARTDADEFRRVYGLQVVTLPTHRPNIRRDLPDVIFKTEAAKYGAVTEEVAKRHTAGQPVLVGTVSIAKSQRLSTLLTDKGIPHRVLNAHAHQQEAEIIREAGQRSAVTIATNMAGRGTDIRLGEDVAELGGLHVIGTERHDSRRIDNQLRGRAGRQGDPGSSQFFLSLEDQLMQRFDSAAMKAKLEKQGYDEQAPLEGLLITRSIETAQNIVEGIQFEALTRVMQFDEVLDRQRKRIYRDREDILRGGDTRAIMKAMIDSVLKQALVLYCPEAAIPEHWELDKLVSYAEQKVLDPAMVTREELVGKSVEELTEVLAAKAMSLYERRETILGAEACRSFERFTLIRMADQYWQEHLRDMEQLREGIHLRVYSGQDPLQEYESEGHNLFKRMVASIEEESVRAILKIAIVERNTTDAQAPDSDWQSNQADPDHSQAVS
ncbi:preprotein translocase subunit SecA [Paenibacillus daejeonensis]|uniref:preprotein translocase subunit SecA n=1 Tax=Paenibacillus daejeonensis TaxID=135193 RepID=UPI0003610E12|nr:preprotein translocase subunit SecA [Paenibacillus daejeonensis]